MQHRREVTVSIQNWRCAALEREWLQQKTKSERGAKQEKVKVFCCKCFRLTPFSKEGDGCIEVRKNWNAEQLCRLSAAITDSINNQLLSTSAISNQLLSLIVSTINNQLSAISAEHDGFLCLRSSLLIWYGIETRFCLSSFFICFKKVRKDGGLSLHLDHLGHRLHRLRPRLLRPCLPPGYDGCHQLQLELL